MPPPAASRRTRRPERSGPRAQAGAKRRRGASGRGGRFGGGSGGGGGGGGALAVGGGGGVGSGATAKPATTGPTLPAGLSMIVFKNKFVDLDPTHIRFGLCCAAPRVGGRIADDQVEVHHSEILEYYEEMGAFYHYYFFRSRLEDATVAAEHRLTPTQIDEMLERVLLFLVEASGVPVLLSMLVLIFASGARI